MSNIDFPVAPNQGPTPSSLTNNPELSVLLNSDGPVEIGVIRERAAVEQGGVVITPQGPVNDLMALRASFPFLPIIPPPNTVRTFFLDGTNAQDVNVPDGMCAGMFLGSNDFYVGFFGKADVPSATTAGNADNTSRSIYSPQGVMFYLGQVRQFSINAPNASTIVTVMFYAPNEWPRY